MQVLSTCHFEPCSKSSGSLLAVPSFWTTLCLCLYVFVRFRCGDFLAVVTQVLETSCKLLHRPPKKRKWALYNPSLLELSFPAFLDHGQGLTPCPSPFATPCHSMPPHATRFHKTHRHMMTHGQSRRQKMCPCAHLG